MSAIAKRVTAFIQSRPALDNMMKPIANKYMDLAGYRKLGLLYDDILAEENPIVQKALKRLPPRLAYDRMFRHRRAMQCSLSHQLLPLNEQTKPEQDINYLRPYIEEIEREMAERKELDSLTKSK
ncbi:cytochrome b-c1 complex subunit 7 [Tricharina praecox]|uniref:cytochrome b-c1 complex subunit 7 n=1 Tax=Tricharina praecox TaxID=43433 RepID=UPI0022204B0A|nr:cytochrome b-c1 complex subunit 7 [Tricharina praecox]KAI5857192.1 cytochrome b-c1 complex subunit 7 [Tricharina praecox]